MDLVRYELKDGLAVLTMNDPATMNAASVEMAQALTAAFARAAREARSAVLTGEGRGFCSGAKLGPQLAPPEGERDAGAALETIYNPLVSMIRDLPIPVVTAVNGAAAGVGCSIALLGDLIVASDAAYFMQAFRRIGLVPDGGSTYMLTRAIGRSRAMEMMLLGERVSAQQALDWGLINRCVPAAELMPTALGLAKELANGPKSIAMIRRIAWAALDNSWHEQLRLERMTQKDAGLTEDFIEGVTAFMEKRPAQFKGK